MFTSFTDTQVFRIYNRLLTRVTRDMFGACWHTLAMTNPALYNSLRAVTIEVRNRTTR